MSAEREREIERERRNNENVWKGGGVKSTTRLETLIRTIATHKLATNCWGLGGFADQNFVGLSAGFFKVAGFGQKTRFQLGMSTAITHFKDFV